MAANHNFRALEELEDEINDISAALEVLPERLVEKEFEEVEALIEKMETLATNLRTYMQDAKKAGEE